MVVAFGGSNHVSPLGFARVCHWLRIETRIADGVECQSVGAFIGLDLQRPRAQLKTQRTNSIQRFQSTANLSLLRTAIHGRYAKQPSLAALGWCCGSDRPWIEACLADCIERQGQGVILRIDLQSARAELEAQ